MNKTAPAQITLEGWPVRQLTQAEQEEHRLLGLCYNCDEKFGRGHNRICKQLFLLNYAFEDAADTEAAAIEEAEENPHFSLNTITGVTCGDTMQVRVTVGTTVFTALLDLGSTHNFIVEDVALHTGLPLQRYPHLTATVATGERVTCPGVIRQALLTIGDDAFCADLIIMPLAGYDLVLGT